VQRIVTALVLSLIALGSASADVRILSSLGGNVGGYLQFFSQLKQSGQRVAIDGPCFSACTLVLSTIPRNRICVTPRAVLGFHAPQIIDQSGRRYRSSDVTRAMAASYPAGVQSWIKRKGGLKQKPIFLRGRELTALYPRC
jgi:hypothetical protein